MTDYQYPIPDPHPMYSKDPDGGTRADVWEGEHRLSKHGRFVELWKGSLGWMGTHSDWHSQHAAHKLLKRVAVGALLVAGLGAGFDVNQTYRQVSSVTVVEKQHEVVTLCRHLVPDDVTIITRDIEDYLADAELRAPLYDTAYFDHTEDGFSEAEQARLMVLLDGWLKPGAQVVFWQVGGLESRT